MKKPREYVSSKEIKTIKNDAPKIKGSFLIGAINPKTGKFNPRYLGVSFTDLMSEIISCSNLKENKNFDRYRLVKTKTNAAAWELACKTYHEFKDVNNLTNKQHIKCDEDLSCTVEGCEF